MHSHDRYWYGRERAKKLQDATIHEPIIATVSAIASDQAAIYRKWEKYAAQYLDRKVTSFTPGSWTRFDGKDYAPTYNVVRSCVNTVVSRTALHEPMSRVLTSNAEDVDQEKAQNLEKFIAGARQAAKTFPKARAALRDAALYGIGYLKVFAPQDGGRVCVEHRHPSRIIVDEQSALDGPPPSRFEQHWYPRDQLVEMFPDRQDEIDGALEGSSQIGVSGGGNYSRDLVEVIEAWYVPEANIKGRHCIVIQGATLLDEDFDGPWPFVVFRWNDGLQGWHGSGIGEELEGIQATINEIVEKVQLNMDLLAVPYIIKNKATKVIEGHLETNKPARIVEYTGSVPPKVETPPAVHPQVIQWLEQLYHRAFEIVGISQMSATSANKTGSLRSGLAVMTVQDVETQRFSQFSHHWQEVYAVDLGNALLAAGKRVRNWKVRAASREFIEHISWADVSMPEDMFVLQLFPQSALPQQPAGRREFVVRMVEAGIMDPMQARQYLQLEDIDKFQRLANAEFDYLERIFEKMKRDQKYVPPVSAMNLEYGIKLAVSYYARFSLDDADEAAGLVLQWIEEATDMLAPPPLEGAPGAPGPGGPLPPGPPPGPPSGPPTGALPPGMVPPNSESVPPELAAMGAQ